MTDWPGGFLGEIHAIFLAFDSVHPGNLGSWKVVVAWIANDLRRCDFV